MSATVLRRAGLAVCEGIALIYVAPVFWGVPHKMPAGLDPLGVRPLHVGRAGASAAHDSAAGEDADPARSKAARLSRGTPPRGLGGRPPH